MIFSMKKIIIIILSIFILLALALSVFIFTFDANRYKGLLEGKIRDGINKDVKIDDLSLSLLDGLAIKAQGVSIKDIDKTWDEPLLKANSIDVSVKIMPLLKNDIQVQRLFIPELEINAGTSPDSPVFRCALDLKIRILINSPSQDNTLRTLTAKGDVKLNDVVLDNMNVLRVALDKLSMLPGLVQKLQYNLPEKYKQILDKTSTEFRPMAAGFEIKEARIFFNKLMVESEAFYLTSKGSVGFNGDLEISSILFIPKDLSDAFINVVPELGFLKDSKGNITMPLDIKGKLPDISVMPNLDYVIQKLAVLKGREILRGILDIINNKGDEQ